jgi:hypothetical protein
MDPMENTVFYCQECVFIGPLRSSGYMWTTLKTPLVMLVLLSCVHILGVAQKCVYMSQYDTVWPCDAIFLNLNIHHLAPLNQKYLYLLLSFFCHWHLGDSKCWRRELFHIVILFGRSFERYDGCLEMTYACLLASFSSAIFPPLPSTFHVPSPYWCTVCFGSLSIIFPSFYLL